MHSNRQREKLWLHESTQRSLFRFAILLLGVLPLLATVSFVVVSRTSWYQLRQAAYWRERIRNNIGLDVVFSAIEMPAPDRFRIHELLCADPETQTPILMAHQVDGEMTAEGWAVTLHAAEMRQDQSDLALKILHDSFLCRPHNSVPILKLSIDNIRILPSTNEARHEHGTHNLALAPRQLDQAHHVQIEYIPSLEQSEIKIQFDTLLSGHARPAIVHVVRNHAAENPRTEWAIDTRDVSVPCPTFRNYFPILEHVGNDAMFRGQVAWYQDKHGWECRLTQSQFANTSWERLTAKAGTPLHGTGTLLVTEAIIRNGVIDHVDGAISSRTPEPAQVDARWLKESIATFAWAADAHDSSTGLINLGYLNLGFSLSPQGLQWRGLGPAIPEADGAQPKYDILAYLQEGEGYQRVATPRNPQSAYASLSQVGNWLAGQPAQANAIAESKGENKALSTWQATLSGLLPSDSSKARLSGLPSNMH